MTRFVWDGHLHSVDSSSNYAVSSLYGVSQHPCRREQYDRFTLVVELLAPASRTDLGFVCDLRFWPYPVVHYKVLSKGL